MWQALIHARRPLQLFTPKQRLLACTSHPRRRSPSWQATPQQRAARLARQAADLEEESKRVEAQACYLRKEAEQLGGEFGAATHCSV